MSWNYRVVRRSVRYRDYEESFSAVHEAYYEDGRECDLPHAISCEPAAPMAETVDELREMHRLMLLAFDEPQLDWNDFPSSKASRLRYRSIEQRVTSDL